MTPRASRLAMCSDTVVFLDCRDGARVEMDVCCGDNETTFQLDSYSIVFSTRDFRACFRAFRTGTVDGSFHAHRPIPQNVRSEATQNSNESPSVSNQATLFSSARQYLGHCIFPLIVCSFRAIPVATRYTAPGHPWLVQRRPVFCCLCFRRSMEVVYVCCSRCNRNVWILPFLH